MEYVTDEVLGLIVKTLREDQDMTQRDVAQQMGWIIATVSRVEGGQRSLKASELPALADVLGVRIQDLYRTQIVRKSIDAKAAKLRAQLDRLEGVVS